MRFQLNFDGSTALHPDFPLFGALMFRLYTPVFPGSRKGTFDAKSDLFWRRTPDIRSRSVENCNQMVALAVDTNKLELKIRTGKCEDTLDVQRGEPIQAYCTK